MQGVHLHPYRKDIDAALAAQRFNVAADGSVSLFNDGLVFHKGFGEFFNYDSGAVLGANLVVDQGIRYLFNAGLGPTTAKISAWFLAMFGGSSAPTSAWTAQNFTSNSTEITSTSEGHTETTRPAVTFVEPTAVDQIDNYAAKSAFTIATASELTVTGVGLVSSSVRGGTAGVLLAAAKFPISQKLQNGGIWQVGYRLIGATA